MKTGCDQSQKVIILLGPPGSGKGTQAARLVHELSMPHISTGDLFRENIRNSTDLGKKAKTYIDHGKLVPDSLVLDMLFNRVSRDDCASGYLLDGFPRTISQAEIYDASVSKDTKVVVIELMVSDELIIKRISGRLSCPKCGNIQNRFFSAPKELGICDKCGGALVQRDDDKPEVVEERLKVYHKQTAPLTIHYQNKGLLHQIDGQQAEDEIFQQVTALL